MDFRILGPLEVCEGSRRLALGGPKQRAVLAVLLLHANEVVAAGRLIDALWGDDPPETAAKVLQGYVSQLRKALERPVIVTRSPGYLVAPAADELDLHRFERLLGEGRSALARGEAAGAADLLQAALALWRGPPLADFADDDFAQAEIGRLEELRLVAREQRLEADLALGRHAAVVGELERLVDEQPLRERLRALLMLALYRSGRQAEALQAYREARSVLVEGLGIDPGPELQRLEQAVLRHDPALDFLHVSVSDSGGAAESEQLGFVGREAELGLLLTGLEQMLRGRGSLYLLAGEPGIGKSRLAEELAGRARARGARVLVGRCWEAGGAPAYWPWVQSLRGLVRDRDPERLRLELGAGAPEVAQLVPELRQIFPDLPEPQWLESEGARIRLFDAACSFVLEASRAQPLVLVLDDLHAADESSLLLLQFVARELAEHRLLVVAAFRDVDPTIGGPLAATLAELAREPVAHRLAVEGLDETAVGRYVELTAGGTPDDGLVDAIYAETDGNPLFVGELVRLLSADGRLDATALRELRLPEGIRAVIGRRVHRLSPRCRRAITLASVLGREFDLQALDRVSGDSGDLLEALDEALSARVVVELPGAVGRLRFAHALIRDAVYEDLTSVRRARLHEQAGEALEDLYAGDLEPHLAELAHHFYAAAAAGGDASRAIAHARRAGDRAARLLAFEEAGRLYELALELAGKDRGRCEILLALGDAQARSGDTPASRDTFLAAAELAAELGLPELRARAALGYGGRLVWGVSRDSPRLEALLEGALAVLGTGDSPLRVRVMARLAGGPLRDASFPLERRLTLGREALEMAQRIGDPATLAYATTAYIASHHSPEFTPEQLERSTEVIRAAMEAGDKEREVEGRENRLVSALELGKMDQARADLEAMTRLADELRQPTHHWFATVYAALIALLEGRFAEAEGMIAAARTLGERAESWSAAVTFGLQLYVLRWEQRRLDEMEELVRSSVSEYPTYPLWRCLFVHLTAALGREAEARGLLRELAVGSFAAIPFDEEWLVSMGFLVEAMSELRDPEDAADVYERMAPYSGRVALCYPEISIGAVARSLGILAALLGRWDDAEARFETALVVNAKVGAVPWIARTQVDCARMLGLRDAPGDRERAAALVAESAETRRRLGLPAL